MRVQWVEVEGEGEEALMNALLGILRSFAQPPLPISQPPPLPSTLILPPPLPPTVIFVPSRASCQRTASFLKSHGIAAAALHGGSSLQQALDEQVLLQQGAIWCIGCISSSEREHAPTLTRGQLLRML